MNFLQLSILYLYLYHYQPSLTVDVPRMYVDAPDSILVNCKEKCINNPKNKLYCNNYNGASMVSSACFDRCDATWQKNWNGLSFGMKTCLGKYYDRFRIVQDALNDKDCGIVPDSFINLRQRRFKVYNGHNAHRYQFPWVLRFRFRGVDAGATGSGVYIGKGYALTAAHLVRNRDIDRIFVSGGHNEIDDLESSGISKAFIHDDVDLAMVKLKDSIDGLVPICIAPKSQPFPTQLRVAGWGKACSLAQAIHCVLLVDPEQRRNCKILACKPTKTLQWADLTVSTIYPHCENQPHLKANHYVCARFARNGSETMPGDSGSGWISKENNIGRWMIFLCGRVASSVEFASQYRVNSKGEKKSFLSFSESNCVDLMNNCNIMKQQEPHGCESGLTQPSTVWADGYLKQNCPLTCNYCTNPVKTGVLRWKLFAIYSASNYLQGTFVDIHSEANFKWICENAPEINVPWGCARLQK